MKKMAMGTMLLWAAMGSLSAQSNTVVCAGADKNSKVGDMSYTIGQVDYLYTKNSHGGAVAGVNQPYEENFAHHLNCDGVELTLFPNPVHDNFYVQADLVDVHYSYVLTDVIGKLIAEGKLTGEYTAFSLTGYPAGTYYLKIKYGSGSEDYSTFKIIKD